MKQAVIFDFDYTLGDSTEGIVKSTDYALMKLGEEKRSRDEIKKTVGLSLHETYKVLTGNDDDDRAELFKKYFIEQADRVMVDSTELYDNSLGILEGLKKDGYKTAIVTTKLNSRIKSILKKFSASHLIDEIVGVENVKNVKPDPEGLLLVCEKLSVKPKDAIYIGDSYVDAKAAQNAKMDFLGVLTGTTTRQMFEEYNCLDICDDIEKAYKYVIINREEI